MTVQRVPEAHFAQIANAALRDKRLSFRARGILAMVLSHVGEWEASARWIGEQGPEGRDAVQTALNELTEHGYRTVTQESTGDGGIRTVVVWRHVPEVADSQSTGNSTTEEHARRESRAPIEHHPSEHHLEPEHQTDLSAIVPFAGRQIAEHLFEQFWQAYPRKAGKVAARKAFDKVMKMDVDPLHVIDAAVAFRLDPNRLDEFTPHPATWLNQGRWDDDPLPAREGAVKPPSGTSRYFQFSKDDWTHDTPAVGS